MAKDKGGLAMKAGVFNKKQLVKFLVEKGLTEKQANTQIAKGINIEAEHTSSKKRALQIASDHLVEFPRYYTGLAKLEKELAGNKANIGKALGLGVASLISSSVASRASNPIVRAVARGVSVGTAIGSIGALLEEPKPKPTARQIVTTHVTQQQIQAIEEVKELPKRERNVIANAKAGEAFIAFTYKTDGPSVVPNETTFAAFLYLDTEYSVNFAAQSIRDKIGGNWKLVEKYEVPYNVRESYDKDDKPIDAPLEPLWFKRVKIVNKHKKNKKKTAIAGRKQSNAAGVSIARFEYFYALDDGIQFNLEEVKILLSRHGIYVTSVDFKREPDKKIHELLVHISPKNAEKLKNVEMAIDKAIKASKIMEGGARSIIVQATPKNDLLFIIEDGIAMIYESPPKE